MRISREPAHSYRDIGHNIQGILTNQSVIRTLLTEAACILHGHLIQLPDDMDSGGVLGNALLLFLLLVKGEVMRFLHSRGGSGVRDDLHHRLPVIVPAPVGIGMLRTDEHSHQQCRQPCSIFTYAVLFHNGIMFCCLLTSLANFRYFPVSPAFSISWQKWRMPSMVSPP